MAAELKGTAAEGKVSKADLIAMAGAHAIAICGGPVMQPVIGRRDAQGQDPEGRLPSEKLPAKDLKLVFASMGLSVSANERAAAA